MRSLALGFVFAMCTILSPTGYAQQQTQPVSIEPGQADASTLIQADPADSAAAFVIADSLRIVRPDYIYRVGGKRDPFESLVPEENLDGKSIKQLFEYEGATILGVVDSEKNPYALVVDAARLSFILHVGDRVQGGQVTRIADGAVYIHIVKYGRSMNIILRMESSRYTLIEEEAEITSLKKPGIDIVYGTGPTPVEESSTELVTVPLSGIRTVEEEWFGTGGMHSNLRYFSQDALSNTLLLMYPSPGSWIRLPYQVDWESPASAGAVNIEIDDSPDFSSPLVIIQNVISKPYLIDGNLRLPVNTALYWRATGTGENGSRFGCEPEKIQFYVVGQ